MTQAGPWSGKSHRAPQRARVSLPHARPRSRLCPAQPLPPPLGKNAAPQGAWQTQVIRAKGKHMIVEGEVRSSDLRVVEGFGGPSQVQGQELQCQGPERQASLPVVGTQLNTRHLLRGLGRRLLPFCPSSPPPSRGQDHLVARKREGQGSADLKPTPLPGGLPPIPSQLSPFLLHP